MSFFSVIKLRWNHDVLQRVLIKMTDCSGLTIIRPLSPREQSSLFLYFKFLQMFPSGCETNGFARQTSCSLDVVLSDCGPFIWAVEWKNTLVLLIGKKTLNLHKPRLVFTSCYILLHCPQIHHPPLFSFNLVFADKVVCVGVSVAGCMVSVYTASCYVLESSLTMFKPECHVKEENNNGSLQTVAFTCRKKNDNQSTN